MMQLRIRQNNRLDTWRNEMKTAVVYTSQTGFTKRYAEWIAERTRGDAIELGDAKKKDLSG